MSVQNQGADPVKVAFKDGAVKESTEGTTSTTHVKLWGSCRLWVVALCNLGLFFIMYLRFNLSVAIVCMNQPTQSSIAAAPINRTVDNTTSTLNHTHEQSDASGGEFNFDKDLRNGILGSFFYGYLATQILGGWICDRFGPKIGIVAGIGVLSMGAILSPPAVRLDPSCLIAIRVIQGLASGLAFPGFYAFVAIWTSPDERATLMSLAFCGISIANIVTPPLSGLLCECGVDGGWPMVFYLPGVGGLLWTLAFFFLVYPSPAHHPRITSQEKQAHMTSANFFYLLAVNLPTFFTEGLHMTIVQNGLSCSMPNIGMLVMVTSGKLFDFIKHRNVMSFTNLRKLFNTFGFVAPAVCMFLMSALREEDWVSHVALLAIGMTLHETAITGGFYFNHPDIAGRYKTVAFGITNTFAQLTGFLNPFLVAKLTPDSTREQWLVIFQIASGAIMFGAIVYLFLGSAEPEPWALDREDEKQSNGSTKQKIPDEESRDISMPLVQKEGMLK